MSSEQKTSNKAVKGLAYGLVVGWMVGMLWWASLMIAFGPSVAVTHDSEGWHERQITVWSRLVNAPLVAIPWAIVGGIVGAVIGWRGGWLEIVTVFGGMIGGICHSLLLNVFDGWLALTMPINAFVGTFIGLAGGCLVRLVSKVVKA
jgi:hypothetical protein